MKIKPGRNDPCYCGSGKKYKKCHLPLDEKERLASLSREPEAESLPESVEPEDRGGLVPELKVGSGKPRTPGQLIKALAGLDLVKHNPELRRIFEENKALFDFMGHEEEIEAALEKMKPHKEEFERLLEDEQALRGRSSKLFDEEPFAPLRFTAADVQRAFEKVGFPSGLVPEEQQREIYVKAILFVATKERRDHLWRELLLRLPEYVNAGRFLDAHLIDFAAQITGEATDEPDPFLMQMFFFGLREWAEQREREQEAFLSELGVDPLKMKVDEIEASVANAMADPAKAARFERFLATHPALQQSRTATMDNFDRLAIRLLDRPEAAPRLLPLEENEPWFLFLMEKLKQISERHGLNHREGPPPEAARKAVSSELIPVVRELTKGIFNPERIRRLVADLREYREELFESGDKEAAFWAGVAMRYVKPEEEPEENAFLLSLCFKAMLPTSPHRDEPGAEAEAAEAEAGSPPTS